MRGVSVRACVSETNGGRTERRREEKTEKKKEKWSRGDAIKKETRKEKIGWCVYMRGAGGREKQVCYDRKNLAESAVCKRVAPNARTMTSVRSMS
jgi:hypothetical protein